MLRLVRTTAGGLLGLLLLAPVPHAAEPGNAAPGADRDGENASGDHSAVARRALAEASLALDGGAYAQADDLLARAASLDPGFWDVAYFRARVALRAGDVPDALGLLDGFLARAPAHAAARLLRARARRALGLAEPAWRDYAEVIRRAPTPDVYVEAVRLLLEGDGVAQARAARLLDAAREDLGPVPAIERLRAGVARLRDLPAVGARIRPEPRADSW